MLEAEAIPAEIGIYYVFKDEAAGQQYLASRYRRTGAAPRKRVSEVRFEENRELLDSFMATIAALGRLPEADEFAQAAEVETRFGSLKRAFALIKRVTGSDDWDAIARRNTEDLLVYLALGRFRRRPPISALPVGLQRDIRSFFGSYANACRLADDRLFRAGDAEAVDDACRRSAVGKLLPNALYVHRTRPRIARPAAPRLRGLRPGLPRRDRGRRPDQAAPPLGQGLLSRLPRLRGRPAPGPAAEHQAQPAVPRDREHRLRREREPADPAPQGDLPAARPPAPIEVRAAHPPRGAGRPAGRDGDDRHAGRMAGTIGREGIHDSRASIDATGRGKSRGRIRSRVSTAGCLVWGCLEGRVIIRARRKGMMMSTVTLEEAQGHLAFLIERLQPGEEIIITRDDKPIARLVAESEPSRRTRRLGTMKGTIVHIADDFDAPLEEFREYME